MSNSPRQDFKLVGCFFEEPGTKTITVTRPDPRKILLALDKLQVALVKDDEANTHRPIIELSWARLVVSGSHLVETAGHKFLGWLKKRHKLRRK